ncbi:hypothetical protein [Croceicoccus sp. YJ47]|uniref:DUF7303 family protein n=1 Tax=Croceicoccus sp. YJ47 TaxID=2798724 RepID=UPI0019225120|nr:hypothetical protein [Croceicoccus sp. YJ47]QQN73927.1 hypothetical protein JD971_14450 [Croceicoccus sp. YJ47]
MAIKIEKGVPLPSSRQAHVKYPFNEMEVGDSFKVTLAESHSENVTNLQRALGSRGAQVLGKGKVATRQEGDAVRVWRVA